MTLEKEQLIQSFATMVKIRTFEENASRLFAGGKIPGFVHLYIGEEAVATGVCAALRVSDYITSTHRGHGHLIAKGGDIRLMMAELFGKRTGYCKGKGGSMHIADLDLGILGANGIVGGGPPQAVGAALACQYRGSDSIAVCFFGDGASNQGTTHEAMNLASCWKLPVVFVNENNRYGISCCIDKATAVENLSEKAAAFGMRSATVDGNDMVAVYEAASNAVRLAREGHGPTLVECKTYRHHGHFEGDPGFYRPAEEVEKWLAKDPIPRFEQALLEAGMLTATEVAGIREKLKNEIEDAIRFAEESPFPETSEVTEDVYNA
ncbi:MAG: thiamine pyrophosphate-dependent dehydrogenase E1 component subunit alpha [Deltaproteobacteria bacterium]|nr:thiamine pyrophosphate-dependent dehydrogenase E1 component subunit alpha [Deltaproteobacteria bacterium]